ncbi:MAG: phenylalanine--tRNA ligase subunit beta [Dehalococcoidales bacterium]|nr:phenylalanine--tRNA ligase subunit beta [Dehalococcoidales bacterium]
MKVSVKWLKEYVNISLPPTDLSNRLTMAGIEVKGQQIIGGNWENVVVGQIIDIKPHPNADRLTLPTIDVGKEQHTVVCGAPNLKIGDKIAFAYVGAQLIDGHTGEVGRLKPAKIRGVVSAGMVCSEKELGISDMHEGIMVLPADAPVGTPLTDYLGDTVLDLEVTPNRPDCLSTIGIAREIAVLTGEGLRLPEVKYREGASATQEQVAVEIADSDLCPRYDASIVNGVKIAESPKWLQQRLLACGIRPINNVVDVTNYVMLEYGQPLHSFDYDRIVGKKITVRRAVDGEVIDTLDGVARALSRNMLVIADEKRAVAVAGVMGGANSEVTAATTAILLEAANFNPASIHYTARQLQLPSEASMRFERGIRSELALPALKRATQLLAELAGGEVSRGLIDVYPGKEEPKPIRLSADRVKGLLGLEMGLEQIISLLASLGFECLADSSGSEVRVTAPYWRSDIRQPVDLIEEIARINGYDRIPEVMLSQPVPRHNPEPILGLKQKVRLSLIGSGFQEIITYSLTSLQLMTWLSPEPHPLDPVPVRIANPMTAEQEYLRANLRPHALMAVSTNRRHEDEALRLFELGRVYWPRDNDLPEEPEILCAVMCGSRLKKSWQGGGESPDFYDAKGIVEGLFNQLGVVVSFEDGHDESLRSGKQAAIIVSGDKLGVIGELHPKVAAAFEINEVVYLFELNLSKLLNHVAARRVFQPIPRFPPTVRDIALVVDASVIHQRVVDIIKSFDLVSQVSLFDAYAGEQIPPGKKSLAYRITFQSPTHTLTELLVNKIQDKIVDRLSRELGATLRT